MDGYSITPQEERLKALRSLMPEVFNEGKIDWEKLKATLGENINFSNERYVLNWAGKSDAFRVMQQPSSATLVPCREESVDFDNTQNIFIEGENMEVLKVLQKSYFNKIKMIYIDPPYNTGNDSFIYPDKFSETKEEYMRRVGDKDEDGYMTREGMFRKNSKENGQYHSNWLNMMMPRLYLAKSLLREDGVIFASIDDNEVHNLRLLMNEIFGEENFVAQMVWQGGKTNTAKFISTSHEYILIFAKSLVCCREKNLVWKEKKRGLEAIYKKREELMKQCGNDYEHASELMKKWFANEAPEESKAHAHYCNIDEKGLYCMDNVSRVGGGKYSVKNPVNGHIIPPPSRGWVFGKEEDLWKAVQDGRLVFMNNDKLPILKRYLHDNECQLLDTVFYKDRRGARLRLRDMMGEEVFDFPKDELVLANLIDVFTNNDNIILDFFAGSGTTAHAVMQLNKEDGGKRKYICVQLPELCDEKNEAYKAGYKTIAEISKERIRRAGIKIRTEVEAEQAKQQGRFDFEGEKPVMMPDLGFKVFKLVESNFKQWRDIKGSDKEDWKQQLIDFLDPLAKNATVGNMVYELLLKSGKDLNSRIEHKAGYYTVNDGELILMLESATQETVDAVLAAHPQKVIALDNLFEGNDQLKTNTVLQMRDGGIEFKTI